MFKFLAFALAIVTSIPNPFREQAGFSLTVTMNGSNSYGPIMHFKLTNETESPFSFSPVASIDQSSVADAVAGKLTWAIGHCPPAPTEPFNVTGVKVSDEEPPPIQFVTLQPHASIELEEQALLCRFPLKRGQTISGIGVVVGWIGENGKITKSGVMFKGKFTITL